MEQVLIDLMDVVKSVAPDVWAIVVRQKVYSGVIGIVVALIIGALSVAMYRYSERADEFDKDIFVFIAALIGFAAVIVLAMSSMYVINPQYYAILDIVRMVR